MEEWIGKILREIGEWRRETREQLMEERRLREEEKRKKKEEWRAEKNAIEKRLVDLEWKNEKTERQNRRKNIIIKGLKEEHEMVEQDIEKYIEEILKIEVRIKKVSEIRMKEKNKWRIAELESSEQEREVMEKKRYLEKDVRG